MQQESKGTLYVKVGTAAMLLAALCVIVIQTLRYRADQFGYTPDPEGTKRFLATLDEPLFAQAGREVIQEAKGKETFLYRSAYKAHQALYHKPWTVERQGIGDCVSWGFSHSVWFSQCLDWETGRLAMPPPFPSTEALYGGSRVEARGKKQAGYSDGSYGGAAAKWIRNWGIVYRQQYPGHDLTKYSADRAKDWGNWGCGGRDDNGKLDAIAKQRPASHVALVTSFKEAAAAIESGFPIAVCSGYGFRSTRDSQAFCAPSGSWAHCMALVAVRYDRPGCLCLNSWGPSWVSGPKYPDDMPDGSFWIDAKTVDGMLEGEDSFAIGGIDGFKWRDLHHGDWLSPAPPESVAYTFSLAP